jgi:hypothetical protein
MAQSPNSTLAAGTGVGVAVGKGVLVGVGVFSGTGVIPGSAVTWFEGAPGKLQANTLMINMHSGTSFVNLSTEENYNPGGEECQSWEVLLHCSYPVQNVCSII